MKRWIILIVILILGGAGFVFKNIKNHENEKKIEKKYVETKKDKREIKSEQKEEMKEKMKEKETKNNTWSEKEIDDLKNKKPTKDDIVKYEGNTALKNTLVITAKEGTSREKMKEISEKVGAYLVRYNETFNNGLFIFKDGTTNEELVKIKKELEKNTNFKVVNYNSIAEIEE